MTIEMIDKWVTSLRFNGEKKKKKKKKKIKKKKKKKMDKKKKKRRSLCRFLIDFIFCRLAETTHTLTVAETGYWY